MHPVFILTQVWFLMSRTCSLTPLPVVKICPSSVVTSKCAFTSNSFDLRVPNLRTRRVNVPTHEQGVRTRRQFFFLIQVEHENIHKSRRVCDTYVCIGFLKRKVQIKASNQDLVRNFSKCLASYTEVSDWSRRTNL